MNLDQWSELCKTKEEKEQGHIKAGRDAEEQFSRLAKKELKLKKGQVFVGKRIPNPKGGRYEIDVILLTRSNIHLIEIKNWSGELDIEGHDWIQTNRNGERITHRNISKLNYTKMLAFEEYLINSGVELDKVRSLLSVKTIFMNKNLKLRSSLWSDRTIITYPELSHYMKSKGKKKFGTSFLMALVELIAKDDAAKIGSGFDYNLTNKLMKQVSEQLRKTRTWDEIQLFGGRIGAGDALKLGINNQTFSLNDENRAAGEGIKINWTRNKLIGLIKAKLGKPLGKMKIANGHIPVSPSDYILFHFAGDRKPTKVPLRQVDALKKG